MTEKPTGHRHLKLKLQQLIEKLTKEYSMEKVTTNIIVFKKLCLEIQMFGRGGGGRGFWINELETVLITTFLGCVYKIHLILAAGRKVVQ